MLRRRRAPDRPDDPLGLSGYSELHTVAAGGSSTVYRARQDAFARLVAIKVLALPVLDDRLRRRFERELAIAGRLSGHPNVVTVHASGFTRDGRPYVTMEYCPEGSLSDALAARGPQPVADVLRLGVKIAGALATAHAAGVVHRDVKPANVLITPYGEPALADFGIAVVTGESTTATEALTPVHAAPEVLEGKPAGPASDVWSLGSTLHTLLAGRPPFAGAPGDGVLAGMLRILNEPLPVIPRADVPTGLRGVLQRAMAKDPAARYASAEELGHALQEVQRELGQPVTEMVRAPGAPAAPAAPSAPTDTSPHPGPVSPGSSPPTAAAAPPLPATPAAAAPAPATSSALPPAPDAAVDDAELTRIGRGRPERPMQEVVARPLWPFLLGGVLLAVVAVVVLALTVGAKPQPKPAPTPPAADLSRLAPHGVHVVADTGRTVTLAWTDPSGGRFAYVVDAGSGRLVVAQQRTRTTVTGLTPGKGYCFAVGAVYAVGAKPAYARPVCVRGAVTGSG